VTTAIMGGGSDSKKQLGKILLAQKLVSADVLQDMLDEQKRDPGARLGSVATRRGRVSVHDALQALSEQHGVPPVDLAELVIPLSLLKLVPVEMAREHALLPFKVDGDQLLLAMSSPQLREVIDELEFVVAKKISAHVALDHVVRQVIDYAYGRLEQGDEHYIGSAVSNSQLHQLGLPADSPRAPEPLPPSATGEDDDGDDGDQLQTTVAAPMSDASGLAAALDTAFSQRVMPSQPPVMPAPQADARVLIAHRDEPLRQALRSTLQETGVAVDEAGDGNQALELLRAQHPSVLVVDVSLPLVQGLDVCRRLRASPRYAELPIVVATDGWNGWRIANDLRDGYGIKHFFERPYDVVKLTRTVRLLLDGQDVPEEPPALAAAVETRWNAGMKAFQAGDLDTAIAELQAAAQIDPQAFELQYHLGLLFGRRSELFSAIAALQAATKLQPRHFAAVKNLAVVYQRAGLRSCALDAWERALTCAPDEATRASIKEHMIGLL
jgi:DNA-binding response OmpR family regulator